MSIHGRLRLVWLGAGMVVVSIAFVEAHPAFAEAHPDFIEAYSALGEAHPALVDAHLVFGQAQSSLVAKQSAPADEQLASNEGLLAPAEGQLVFDELLAADDNQTALVDALTAFVDEHFAHADAHFALADEPIALVNEQAAREGEHTALSHNQSRFWRIPPAALGTAWRDQNFQLHSQPFLRIRTRSISTIEGINRAMLEFAIPTQSVDRIELWLEGRDSTEPLIDVLGYTGDGEVSVEDADRIGEIIATIQTPHLGLEIIDVTDFVASQSARGATHVGFRLQLANESLLPLGLNIRAEWRTDARLVVYPTCYADCDSASGSMVLDVFDFLCFQASFVATSPYACDCDTLTGGGICDLFDFLCFQQAYLEGCSP